MAPASDLIVAIATGNGRGGIGVVRLSGPHLKVVGQALTGRELPPRTAVYTPFLDVHGEPIDQGIALYFPAPHSYTGEDVLELQGHGGPAVLQAVLQRCLQLGARLAEPGEFTRRAYLNDKLDLAQAESVADLIEATTQQAARSALRSLQGAFSQAIHEVVAQLIRLRVRIEATLDFPEEDGVIIAELPYIASDLEKIETDLRHIRELAKQGSILREGAQVVLVGPPNVGKSSLLNCLAGEEIALVSEIAGTTRDAIRQTLQIEGVPLHIIDTAGLRDTDDVVERMGIARTQQNIERADIILVLSDCTQSIKMESEVLSRLPPDIPRLFVHNKVDLNPEAEKNQPVGEGNHLFVSAKTRQGIAALQQKLLSMIGWHQESGVFMARARHLKALEQAQDHLQRAAHQKVQIELMAEELRQAQQALNQITGEFSADDLLGEIFSHFCIGK